MTITPTPTSSAAFPTPGSNLATANIAGAQKLSEKTIELSTAAQFGALFGTSMVWFGLTQAQERQHGIDAATNLGGRAFMLQFKASNTVLRGGPYRGCRRFYCQHHQMQSLVNAYGNTPNACFYFLPDFGSLPELIANGGDCLSHSFLVDVATIPNPVSSVTRTSGYHYANLDGNAPSIVFSSHPFDARVRSAKEFAMMVREQADILPRSNDVAAVLAENASPSHRGAKLFYRNAAIVLIR